MDIPPLGVNFPQTSIYLGAISETIFHKAEKLSTDEWSEMKRHPKIGYHILCDDF